MNIRLTKDLQPVLKNKIDAGNKEAYYMFRGTPNLTLIAPGLNGDEYNKTLGHYHKNKSPEEYKVLYGEGIFILQKTDEENRRKIIDLKTIRVKSGDIVNIPGDYGHCLVNIGASYLVTTDNASSNAESEVNDYEPIKLLRGFAIYVVDKNGNIEFEYNNNYER